MALPMIGLKLTDVQTVIQNVDEYAPNQLNSLKKCLGISPYPFIANIYGFDQTYDVNGQLDRLSDFRNYDHEAAAPNYTIGLNISLSSPVPAAGEVGTGTFTVSNSPNSVVGLAFTNVDWITLQNFTNLTNGSQVTITVAAQPLIDSPPRSGKITVSSATTGVTNSPVQYDILQNAGRDYNSGGGGTP